MLLDQGCWSARPLRASNRARSSADGGVTAASGTLRVCPAKLPPPGNDRPAGDGAHRRHRHGGIGAAPYYDACRHLTVIRRVRALPSPVVSIETHLAISAINPLPEVPLERADVNGRRCDGGCRGGAGKMAVISGPFTGRAARSCP
jgi:hypothetical protein